jgi:hypothetical protein
MDDASTLTEHSVDISITATAPTVTDIVDVAVVSNGQFRLLLHSSTQSRRWMQLYNLSTMISDGAAMMFSAVPIGGAVPLGAGVARIDTLSDRVLLADVTADRTTLLVGNASTAASSTLYTDVGALWLDFVLARCALLVLRRNDSNVVRRVDLSSVLCATTVPPPSTTSFNGTTRTFETARTESGIVGGGLVPGFEGTIDPRGAYAGRPPLLGRGVDPARADTNAYGPFSILMIVVAILACVVLSALVGRAVRHYVRQGRVAPNRGNPWRNLGD